jgi:hypothetical protein
MAKKTAAGRMKVAIAFLLLFGPASLLVFISTRGCEHKFKELDNYGKAVNYTFTDARGKQFSSADFKDKIVLVTTMQQTCPDSCAIAFWQVNQAIYQHVRKNRKKLKEVKIISFVTDGEGNPVKELGTLQTMMNDRVVGYDPDIWYLASGNARELYDFSNNDETLLKQGDEYFGGEAFQELILLLDKQNDLRMVLKGDSEGMIRRMKQHMALLQKQYDKEKAKFKEK